MSSRLPHDHDPQPDTHPSLHRKQPPQQDLYLSLADIADLSQQAPTSPRHQRIHTLDNADAQQQPTLLTSARFQAPGGHTRPGSVDSPFRTSFEPHLQDPPEPSFQHLDLPLRDLDQYPRGSSAYGSRSPPRHRREEIDEDGSSYGSITPPIPHYTSAVTPSNDTERRPSHSTITPARNSNNTASLRDSLSEYSYDGYLEEEAQVQEMQSTKPTDLRVDVSANTSPNPPSASSFPKRSTSIKKIAKKLIPPKSPEQPKQPSSGSFWNWTKSPQNNMESPSTQFSDGNTPLSAEHQRGVEPLPTHGEYSGEDNYFGSEVDYSSPRSASPMPYGAQGVSTNVAELLRELQEVSAELAGSIRREMELEDEIDQSRTDLPNGPSGELGRRTSDYYSDSGASSTKLPPPDIDLKMEGLERMRRKAEQEKAQLRVDMAQKVQEDLNQRRALEMHVQSLEEQIQHANASAELEAQLEDCKRRLNDEREFKANFEDLLAGMRQEIESMRNERDNLRDDVVPKLTQDSSTLAYENSRLQQEIQGLKNENSTLQNARKLQLRGISEEGSEPLGSPTGLSRSNSLARSVSKRGRSGSLISGEGKDQNTSEALPDRLKNIEEQRDALHKTLKHLLLRQDQVNRQNRKQIRALETERDKALVGLPKKAAFHVEVQSLRTEINHLRQRADEALDQKFECEKGLSGLKMDLDRAQLETSSLRELLQEHDITVPNELASSASSISGDSLDRAYADLQRAHDDSIAAGQETPTVERMHALRAQVSAQQASNSELHARLAEAIARGEQEQDASTQRINDLQSALRSAEERVMTAQSLSEDTIGVQEDYARDVKESLTDQTSRGMKSLNKNAIPDAKPSPFGSTVGSLFGRKTPQLSQTSSGKGKGLFDVTRTEQLEKRVKELEEAAATAEREMQEVVESMNSAQIEVVELQTQRDEARRVTKRLRGEIEEERGKVESLLKGKK